MNAFKLTVAALAASAAFAGAAFARDQVQVSGSSTVLPYAKIVAETFGETFKDFKTFGNDLVCVLVLDGDGSGE